MNTSELKGKRIHMSDSEEIHFNSVTQEISLENPASIIGKPSGLWYGFGTSWLDWCNLEMPGWVCDYYYEIVLDQSKILTISSIEQFDQFEREFLSLSEITDNRFALRLGKINWVKVSKLYSGIEIVPYLYERRLESMWYYGWDCASGCVWHSDAVIAIKKLNFTRQQRGGKIDS